MTALIRIADSTAIAQGSDSKDLSVRVTVVATFEECAAVTAPSDWATNCGEPGNDLPDACVEGYGWVYDRCYKP